MIIKVQKPIFGGDAFLIYDKKRDFVLTRQPDDNLMKMMGSSLKKYFECEIINHDIIIKKQVADQEW